MIAPETFDLLVVVAVLAFILGLSLMGVLMGRTKKPGGKKPC